MDGILKTLGLQLVVKILYPYNSELWNSGTDANKSTRSRNVTSYYANIYVVKDPTNPENEGSVFLFKFGKKIYDKILAAMQPEFEEEEAIDPTISGGC